MAGVVEVTAGGTIKAGDPVTSDSSGQAIKAAPNAGVTVNVVGRAYEDAVSGDVFRIILFGSGQQAGVSYPLTAGGAIAINTIIAATATSGTVAVAAAATDKLLGVADKAYANGDAVSLSQHRIQNVVLGGTVAPGDPLTSDASGNAIKANPATGVNNRIIGFAILGGVATNIIPFTLSPGQIQG